ncbi:protoporphyrinogen oxidase [Paenibacillus sp. 1011MAR3C5]|uniref:protoporphyrinogen oxidase n=1 Tax=Paenibacillus sp. 1011MAR3C5 TaxID=1675787 RepID=UPI000E6BDB29|nr:protoporphyrinogen oxidase [Paenibacillus sp. 1011MAR3C5]RJE89797.1 protoporphyrinogen oxidase [Paenibacillus sp. 1011MAR3C5]
MRSAEAIDRIVIIGGGISGLSSAFYLQREAERQGRELHLTIVDEAPVLGGKINTLQRDGFVIEKGPDSFLARKQAIIDLAKELGLEDELTATNPAAKKTYIMHNRKLHAMPPGLVLGIPTEIGPFMKTSLLSLGGKLRAVMDLFMPAKPAPGDESLGGFLERRVGTQVMRRIAEPLLAGIYAGDLKKLSLKATFPQFGDSERKHGSLIKGMMHNRKVTAAAAKGKAQGTTFLTFKQGLSTLVRALDEALSGAERRLGVKVTELAKSGSGYAVTLADGETLEADRIVVTAPAFAAAKLLEPLVACTELKDIRYVSVANVVMAFDKKTFGLDFDGSGFVVPRSEGLHITACTWTSSKWLHTSPEDKVLLRCYVGHSEDQESVKLPDDLLVAAVRKDIRETMGITAEPMFTEITRLHQSMPQYPVGHIEKMQSLRSRLKAELPGVWVTGAAFDGVGLPDCIRQGKEAAIELYSATK